MYHVLIIRAGKAIKWECSNASIIFSLKFSILHRSVYRLFQLKMFNYNKIKCLFVFLPTFINKNCFNDSVSWKEIQLQHRFYFKHQGLVTNGCTAVQGWWSGRVGFYHLSFMNIFSHGVGHFINICQKIHQCTLRFVTSLVYATFY